MKKVIVFILCLILTVFGDFFVAGAITARSAVVINGETGEVLYGLNQSLPLPMASTTKIMTALILCKYKNLQDKITVPPKALAVEGTSMGLKAGDVVTYKDLLYGMMLSSGNDAANTTAVSISGSIEKFADLMNKEASFIGLKETFFETPSGLDKGNHHTTAYDLALITMSAMKYSEFEKAVSSKSYKVNFLNSDKKYTLYNHNKLLIKYGDVVGVKTGFTKKAGRCLVSAARRDGKYVIAVTLNDGNDWFDHRTLIDLGYSKLKKVTVPKQTVKIPVAGTNGKWVIAETGGYSIFTAGKNIDFKISVPEFLYSPVKSGDIIGTVTYIYDGKTLKTVSIRSNNSIKAEKRHNFRNLIFIILRGI